MRILKVILLGVILMSGVLLSACNTVKGFGQDMQQGGQELQKAANDNQKSS